MTDEIKQLIEDAAKLLGLGKVSWAVSIHNEMFLIAENAVDQMFDPCDPERGDLMKVAEAAELSIDFDIGVIYANKRIATVRPVSYFCKGDHSSLALAILRAASAVWKARNENAE